MKPSNFPMRKLIRKAKAENHIPTEQELQAARSVRTKKVRKAKGILQ